MRQWSHWSLPRVSQQPISQFLFLHNFSLTQALVDRQVGVEYLLFVFDIVYGSGSLEVWLMVETVGIRLSKLNAEPTSSFFIRAIYDYDSNEYLCWHFERSFVKSATAELAMFLFFDLPKFCAFWFLKSFWCSSEFALVDLPSGIFYGAHKFRKLSTFALRHYHESGAS